MGVTNFDPGGLLMLMTLLVSLPAGVVSIGGAHLAARLGVGDYEQNVAALLGVAAVVFVVAGLAVSDAILQLLVGLSLSVVGAYAVTRSVSDTSVGWLLGVVVLFAAFWAASATGLYQGVNRRGQPIGFVARNLPLFYYGGLLVAGAVGGKVVELADGTLGGRRQVDASTGG